MAPSNGGPPSTLTIPVSLGSSQKRRSPQNPPDHQLPRHPSLYASAPAHRPRPGSSIVPGGAYGSTCSLLLRRPKGSTCGSGPHDPRGCAACAEPLLPWHIPCAFPPLAEVSVCSHAGTHAPALNVSERPSPCTPPLKRPRPGCRSSRPRHGARLSVLWRRMEGHASWPSQGSPLADASHTHTAATPRLPSAALSRLPRAAEATVSRPRTPRGPPTDSATPDSATLDIAAVDDTLDLVQPLRVARSVRRRTRVSLP